MSLISIIIPCYNVEKFIKQCVDSVIKQTLNDIEIICINDGSKDGTLNILRDFEAADNRVKVIDLENGGYGRAVNTGIAAAVGNYIGIVESDDFISKAMYKDLYDLSHNGVVDIVKGNFWNYYDLTEGKHEIFVDGARLMIPDVYEPFTLKECPDILRGHPSIWSGIYRRDFLRENNIKFIEPKGAGWVDNPFFFETLCKAKAIIWTRNPYYYYRKTNPVSSSNKIPDATIPFVRMIDNIDVVERNGYFDAETKKQVYIRALQYLKGALIDCDYDSNYDIINSYAKQLMQRIDPEIILSEFEFQDKLTFLKFASPIKCLSADFSKVLIYNWLPFDNTWNLGGDVKLYCKNLINTILKDRPNTMVYFLSSGFAYDASTTEIYVRKINNIFENRCHSFEIVNSPVPAEQQNLYRNPLVALENPELKKVFSKFLNNFGRFEAIHFNSVEGLSLDVLDLKQEYPDTKFIFSLHNYVPVCLTGYYYQRHNKCSCNSGHTKEDCYKCSRVEIEKDLAVKTYNRGLFGIDPKIAEFQDNWIEVLQFERLDENIPQEKILEFTQTCTEKINRNCDHILAASKKIYDIAAENNIDKNKMQVSYIGTETAKEQVKNSLSTYDPKGSFKIVFFGNINNEESGYRFFLDALESLSRIYASQIDVMFIINQYEHETIYRKLKNFHSIKIKQINKNNDLKEILKGCHLGVVPVMWEENIPQITTEIIAYGVPILSSSLSSVSELCKSELFIFKGGNTDDFINKLVHFIEKPEDLDEYWKYHTGLNTMSEHWKEIVKYFNLQGDASAIEISKQDYMFLILENQFLQKYINIGTYNLYDLQQKLSLSEQRANGLEKGCHDLEAWAKNAEQRANGLEKWCHDLDHALNSIKNSFSFKFGRLVTLIPRKLRDIFRK